MSSARTGALTIVLCGLFASGLAAQERVDRNGLPLPAGAVARLGLPRIWHANLCCASLSPDGKLVASGGWGTILPANADAVTSASPPPTVRLWDVKTRKLLHEIMFAQNETPFGKVHAVLFDATSKTLFVRVGDRLCACDVATGKLMWERNIAVAGIGSRSGPPALVLAGDGLITVHAGGTWSYETSGDSDMIKVPATQYLVRIWDKETGKPREAPEALRSEIKYVLPKSGTKTTAPRGQKVRRHFHEVALSHDGRFAAVVVSASQAVIRDGKYRDRFLQIIAVATGKVMHSLPERDGDLRCLTFADDGETLAMMRDNDIDVLRVATGVKRTLAKDLKPKVRQLKFAEEHFLAIRFADKSPAYPKSTAKAEDDRSDELCNLANGKREPHRTSEDFFGIRATGGKVAARADGDVLRLVDATSGQPLHDGHEHPPLVRFGLRDKNLLLSRDDRRVCRWDTRSWKLIEAAEVGNPPGEEIDGAVALERQLRLLNGGDRLELRDLKTDRLVRVLEKGAGVSGSFAAGGNRVMVAGKEKFRFYDVDSGALLSELPRLRRLQVPLSPQGRYFAVTETETQPGLPIGLYDVGTGKLLRNLELPDGDRLGAVQQLRFSSCDSLVAAEVLPLTAQRFPARLVEPSELRNVVIVLWNAHNGRVVQHLALDIARPDRKADPSIAALAISPDYRLVAFARWRSRVVEVWDVATGTQLRSLPGHAGPVISLAFSEDRRLASSSLDTTVLIWDLAGPGGKFKDRLDEAEVTGHWQTLFVPTADKAELAVASMVHAGDDSVAFLKKNLRPVRWPGEKRVRKLIGELGNADFRMRAKAEAELATLGELVVGEVERALKEQPPLEVQRRLESLVQKVSRPFGTPERLAQWRALEVLERIGSREAKEVLRELGSGVEEAWLTTTARGVLGRMEGRAERP